MAGLLDLPDFNSAAGQGLLAASLSLMGAQKMPGQKGAFGAALANAGRTYMDTRNQAGEQLQAQEYKRLQLDALKRKMTQEEQMRKAAQGAFRSPEMANAMSQGPMPDGSNMPEVLPGFDTKKYMQSLYGIDPMEAMDFQSKLNKKEPFINVPKGGTVLDPVTRQPIFTSPPEEDKGPNSWQEYQKAKMEDGYKGTYAQFKTLGPTITAGALAGLRDAQIGNINAENAYNLPPSRENVKPAGVSVTAGGRTYTFPDQKSANNFRLKAGVR